MKQIQHIDVSPSHCHSPCILNIHYHLTYTSHSKCVSTTLDPRIYAADHINYHLPCGTIDSIFID